ncbi:asparagine synthase-related protein [uncultured Williamsia sp.]|uniref:asparagine synthase-related protein n=1 Tax=uncultured Williamsia sp. TaxID=259311 RepID=UPI00260522CF|nr:asparagine synthase-related protein [uncultured Williamsia sp.]
MITVPPSPLTDLELALGSVIGTDPGTPAIALDEFGPETPRTAVRAVIRGALEHGPCFVAFSGGRDSSTILAIAVDVAREADLALPIPVSKIMPDLPSADESEWQELVLDHLGVTERIIMEVHAGDEEIFGPDGIEALQRIGVTYPAAASSVVRLARETSGGTLLTGSGGDELGNAANSQWAARALSTGTAPWRTRLAARLPVAASAARRVRTLAKKPTDYFFVSPWLTRRADLALRRELATLEGGQSIRWDRRISGFARSKHLVLTTRSLSALAAPYGVDVLHPLWERRTLAALAASRPFQGYPTRSSILEELADGLLPIEVTRRTTKADFTATPWGPEAENFIAHWDGSGVDLRFVNPTILHAQWRLPPVDRTISSIALLQSAWLNSQR